MKKTSTLIIAMLISVLGFGQAITITSTDMPVPTYPFNIDEITATTPVIPTMGDNQTWNYGTNFGNVPLVNNYPVETNSFFTATGVDVSFDDLKDLNAGFGYYVTNEYDFNSNGVYESGANIIAQAYELSSFTGSTADSLIIPAQQYLFSSPKTLIQFPFTKYNSWHSVSSRVTDFNLTVAAYFLNHTPGQQTYTYHRNDSIVGWGKIQVYTTSGPSIQYDVLMEQVEQFAVDSFFLNGSPAPAPLLTAFSVTQGQHTNVQYSYNFYRAGSYNYLMRFNYGSDNTYTALAGAYVNTDNISNVGNISNVSYSTIVFPNPSYSSIINIKVIGNDINLSEYSVTDLLGKIVQHGKIDSPSASLIQLSMNSEIANGTYFIKVKDVNNKEIVSEKINLQR